MNTPRISLEHWRALVAVVDEGSYAGASSALGKSQSAITYAVQQIEAQLDVEAFELSGRKAVLTLTGQMLVRRARFLLEEAAQLERAAQRASAGWEPEIALAVEIIFPSAILMRALDRFGSESPHTRIEVIETVIGGAPEALSEGRVDLAVTPHVPAGFEATSLVELGFVPVAHPKHPLFALGRTLTSRDLRKHRHLVVRDSSAKREPSQARLEAEQRWTVSNMATSIQAATMGFGFSWYPETMIQAELESGALAILPMRGRRIQKVEMFLVIADPPSAGPGVKRLAELLREELGITCKEHTKT